MVVGALAFPVGMSPATAAPPIVVTTTADVVDSGDGVLSLREAVTTANTDAGPDTVQLAMDATYELTRCDGVDWPWDTLNVDGDLNIFDAEGLTIEGNGSTIAQTCNAASEERVIEARDGSLVLRNLTVTGGKAPVNGSYGGAAILIFDADRLELDHVVVRDNTATDVPTMLSDRKGAAIRLELTPAVIVDSEIRDNVGMAGVSSQYYGVDVSRTTFKDNSYPGGVAAAIYGRDVEIADSTFLNNSVTDDTNISHGTGGVLAFGTLTVRRSTLDANRGTGSGAIAAADGLIEDSVLSNNSSRSFGGAMLFIGTIRRTAIVNNTATTGGGGGLVSGTIERSTIAGNSASEGGGISVGYGPLVLRSSTITGNRADDGSGVFVDPRSGDGPESITIERSTVAANEALSVADTATAAEIAVDAAAPADPDRRFDVSHSVIGNGTIAGCRLGETAVVSQSYTFWTDDTCGAPAAGGDIVNGGDPKLGPLQDNGGPTPTRLPLPGSELRDRIPLDHVGCAGGDQRGVPRPQGLGCDIGATEAEVPPAGFVGMAPKRILDTRSGPLPSGWPSGTKLSAAGWLDLEVAGANGVPADATSVVLNVTSTEATSAVTYVAAWPSGLTTPQTSSLNLQPGANVANSITVAPGVDGKVTFAANIGATHLVVDVLGYYSPSGGDRFTGVTPIRMLDTRYGPVPSPRPVGQRLSGPGEIRLPVAGVNGVPADVTSVVVNLTTTQASTDLAFLTAWPAGQARPTASNLNLQPPYNVSNLAQVKVGTGGAIDLHTNTGSTHLVVDVVGYFRPSTGDKFLPLNPTRMFDSRSGPPLGPSSVAFAQVAGTQGVPNNATSVVLNATSTQASSAGGYLTVLAKGAVLSSFTGSNLNYRPPYNAPNQVIAAVGLDQSVGMWNGYGTVHIVLDANGYFVSTP
jgi:hypothetical protein